MTNIVEAKHECTASTVAASESKSPMQMMQTKSKMAKTRLKRSKQLNQNSGWENGEETQSSRRAIEVGKKRTKESMWTTREIVSTKMSQRMLTMTTMKMVTGKTMRAKQANADVECLTKWMKTIAESELVREWRPWRARVDEC